MKEPSPLKTVDTRLFSQATYSPKKDVSSKKKTIKEGISLRKRYRLGASLYNPNLEQGERDRIIRKMELNKAKEDLDEELVALKQ